MAELSVSPADLSALSKKLDDLGDVLTDKERSLLLAVFKLAATAIQSRVQGASGGASQQTGTGPQTESGRLASVPALSEGFRNAFKPLGNADFALRDNLSNAAGGVGIGVVY
jgi:hypothetical protein